MFETMVAIASELCEEVIHTVLIVSFATGLHVKLAKDAEHKEAIREKAEQIAMLKAGH